MPYKVGRVVPAESVRKRLETLDRWLADPETPNVIGDLAGLGEEAPDQVLRRIVQAEIPDSSSIWDTLKLTLNDEQIDPWHRTALHLHLLDQLAGQSEEVDNRITELVWAHMTYSNRLNRRYPTDGRVRTTLQSMLRKIDSEGFQGFVRENCLPHLPE